MSLRFIYTRDARGRPYKLSEQTRKIIKQKYGVFWDKDQKAWAVNEVHYSLVKRIIGSAAPKVVRIYGEVLNRQKICNELQTALDVAKSELETAMTQAVNHYTDFAYEKETFSFSGWECDLSPTGCCVYKNRNTDDCIFCRQPDERK